jgi:amidophosphoribosyltransferase
MQETFSEHVTEKCAVIGIYAKNYHAARLVCTGLWALQHRGQEATGISASNGSIIKTNKGPGLVAAIHTEEALKALPGNLAIGHNRYSTFGSPFSHFQPVASEHNLVTVAHNGNLPVVDQLRNFLKKTGKVLDELNDSELIQMAIEHYMLEGLSVEDAIKKSFPLFTGAFALVILTKDKVIGVRDAHGIRPFCIGKIDDEGYIIASETCALDSIGAEFIRDIKSGEMVVLDDKGLHSYQLEKGEERLDIFELVYFARPDSFMYGKNINEIRREMGRQLAREQKIAADVVIPVPNSAIPASLGYAEESGIKFDHGLLKNSYIHRTFINPMHIARQKEVQIKLIPIREILRKKRVIVIDDSIVRGTTSKKLVSMIRKAGAKEVHLLSASPPVKYPDFYGIATPTQKELIAANMTIEEITSFVGADSVQYLSFAGLMKAIGLPKEKFCTSCFTGEYPIAIGEERKKINFNI